MLDPSTELYHLKHKRPSAKNMPLTDEQRLAKYNTLCRLFHEKHAQYLKVDDVLRRRSERARKAVSESASNLEKLQEFIRSEAPAEQHAKQDEAHARLTRELAILKADIAKVAMPH